MCEFDKKVKELIQGYLEGSMSSEESAEFMDILKKNPQIIDEILDGLTIDNIIRGVLQENEDIDMKQALLVRATGEYADGKKHTWKFQRIVWASLAACLIIAAGAYIFNFLRLSQVSQCIQARLAEVYGEVMIERNGDVIPTERNMEIISGDTIKTEQGGKARVEYTDENTVISISDETEMGFYRKEGARQLHLKNGKIECDADMQPAGKAMKLITPHAEIEVPGTCFTLQVISCQKDKSKIKNQKSKISFTRLEVREGRVKFTRFDNRKSVDVTAGYYAEAGEGIETVSRLIADDPSVSRKTEAGKVIKRWTFEKGQPDDLVVIKGKWEWVPEFKHFPAWMSIRSGVMTVVRAKGLVLPERPFMVKINGRSGGMSNTSLCPVWHGKKNILPCRFWRKKDEIIYRTGGIRTTEHVFAGEYIMHYPTAGRNVIMIRECKDLSKEKDLAFIFENVRVEKIEIRLLRADEIGKYDPDALKKGMEGPFDEELTAEGEDR